VILGECIWEDCPDSELAVMMDTQFYDADEHCFIDYSIADIVCMHHSTTACHLFCPTCMQSFYTHVLFGRLPLESQVDQHMDDLLDGEIATHTVTTEQDVKMMDANATGGCKYD
jgi:hypothetical protein